MKFNNTILTGNWEEDKKHGEFTETIGEKTISLSYDKDVLVYKGDDSNSELFELKKKLNIEREENKRIKEDHTCKICLNNQQNHVIIPCGHLICSDCVKSLDQHQKKCPICRGRFTKHINIYQ